MHRRRRLIALGVVVALALAGTVSGVGPDLVREGFRKLVPSGPGTSVVDEPESLLIAWSTGDAGGAAGVLFGVDPEAEDGGAMLLPGSAQFEVPSLGSRTFTETADAGATSLDLAVENALGVEVTTTLAFEADAVAAVFEPLAPFAIRLRSSLRLGEQAFRSGRQTVTAAQAATLVTEPAGGVDDLDHLVTVHAVLEGWLARLDGDAAGLAAERLGAAGGLDDEGVDRTAALLAELGSRRVVFDTLDVVALGLPEGERYAVDEATAPTEIAEMFGGLVYAADRVNVEIRNGVGTGGLAREVAARVIPAGARVVLTGNAAEFGLEQTFVVVRDAAFAPEAQRLIETLGVGDLRRSDDLVGGADVVIIVGSDFDPGGA